MNPAQKAAFVARMAAARAAKSVPSAAPKMAAKPPQATMQAGWGKCPNCGKNVSAMNHSC